MDMPGLKLGLGLPGEQNIALQDAGYFTKQQSAFHTRLKKSYPIVQSAMEDLMEYEK